MERLKATGLRTVAVNDNLHVIQGENRGRTPNCNSFLFFGEGYTLIDAGLGHASLRKLCAAIRIDRLIITHSHPDHIGGVALLQELCDPFIMVPAQSAASIASADCLARRFMGPQQAQLWKDYYLPLTGFKDFTFHATFDDGHVFEDINLTARHTPGHLNDHYCFSVDDIMIGSDIDLSPFGPWYGNTESDLPAFMRSLDLIEKLDPQVYLPSHARPVSGRHIKKRILTYRGHVYSRDKRIRELLPPDRPFAPDEIAAASPIYGFETQADQVLLTWETEMIRKHLEGLCAAGQLKKTNEHYIRA